jgi:hypothetical protein
VGASLCLLAGRSLLNAGVENFIRLCFKPRECSFSKYPSNESGDPVHTLHSITGIQIARQDYARIDLERGVVREKGE